MFKKRQIITTSAAITLILSNITSVQAEEQSVLDLQNNQPQETEVKEEQQETNSNLSTSDIPNSTKELPQQETHDDSADNNHQLEPILEELYQILNEDQKNVLITLLSNEKTFSNLFIDAIILHNNESFEQANELYEQLLHTNETITDNEKNFIQILIEATEENENLYEVDYSIEMKEAELEAVESDQDDKKLTDSENGESEVSNNQISEDAQLKISLFSTERVSQTKSAEEFYQETMNSAYVSEMWSLGQEFKANYPNDSRLEEAINHAVIKNLEFARKQHNAGNYENGILYYDRILNEALVEEPLQSEARALKEQALQILNEQSADAAYEKFKETYFVSEMWTISQEFKENFPNDPRVSEVVNLAAVKNLEYGVRLHNNGTYDNAITYYNRILNEGLVDSHLQDEAEELKRQAENKLYEKSVVNYLDQVKNAYYISEIWPIIDEFKHNHPKQPELYEAVDYATSKSFEYARKLFNKGDYNNALYYLNRILEEEYANESVSNQAETLKIQAEAILNGKTPENYLKRVKEAYYISEIWPLIDEFKAVYPNNLMLTEAIEYAATKSYEYAAKLRNSENKENALVYLDRILEETTVSESLRSQSIELKNKIEKDLVDQSANKPIKSANDYYLSFIKSEFVSEMWTIGQEFKALFPKDSRVSEVINHAAEKSIEYATRLHNRGNYSQAIIYYDRILKEDIVDSALRSNVESYKNRARKNQKLLSESEYYREATTASTASDRWNSSLEGLSIYPNSSRLRKALNEAAERNLELGRRTQLNGNKSRAALYYNRIINEAKVTEYTRHLAGIFLNQTTENHKPIVYLDPGHGGSDPGATHSGVREKALNMNVSNYLRSELESRGYIVIMSRKSDSFVGLTERAKDANHLEADIFISVHHNSMGGSGIARGIETFIHHTVAGGFGQEQNRNNFEMDDPRIRESVMLADEIHGELIRATGLYNRGVKGNNYNVLRNTYIPAVLLELGFMDNRNELNTIRTQSYQRKSARAIANGIDAYFDNILK